MQEVWAPVLGYNGRYAVSSFGRVMVIGPDVTGRRRYIGHYFAKHLVVGYPAVMLSYGERKTIHVHRLVAQAFLGPPPPGKQVNHKDGDRENARVDNLEYITPSENARHSLDVLGNWPPSGTDHWNARLSEANIRKIFELSADGLDGVQIGKIFGVVSHTITRILAGTRRRKDGYDRYHGMLA